MLRSTGSFASMSTKRTSRTVRSGRTSISETELAALLSRASHQATMAARSILVAGGSRETALSTAQATAQAVLCPSAQEVAAGSITLGKRRAKRHAEIIGSMVLMSLINSHPQQQVTASRHTDALSPLGFSTLDVSADRGASERALGSSLSSSKRSNESAKNEIPQNLPKKDTRRSNTGAENKQSLTKISECNHSRHSSQANINKSQNSSDESDHEKLSGNSLGLFRKKAALSKKTVVKVGTISESQTENNHASGFLDCMADGVETLSTNSHHHSSYSSVESEGDETEHSDEQLEPSETSAVDRASTQGFIKRNVDPLLTTITNAFICGPSNAQTPAATGPGFLLQESRDEPNVRAVGGAARGPPPRNRFSKKIQRNGESLSTYDSAQLLRDLNNSDSSSSTTVPDKRFAKAKKVESQTMEAVVLKALSASPSRRAAPKQTNTSMLRSTDDVFAGIASDGSTDERPSSPIEAAAESGFFQFNSNIKGGRFRFLSRRKKKNAKRSE